MIRAVFIFRDPFKKGHSIEELFKGVIFEFNKYIKAECFFYNSSQSLFRNVLRLRAIQADIYHITGDVNYMALFLPKSKVVLTLHDIGHFKSLKNWHRIIYGLLWIRLPLLRSAAVTAVSSYTRNDIAHFFPTFSSNIIVVPNPVPTLFKFQPSIFNTSQPRILQVGTGPHKNLSTLVRAISGVRCHLAIIGLLSEDQKNLLQEYNIQYENFVDIKQEEVYEQYVLCDFVCFVSTHEGFGMPILEAQAVGRPIITSNVCSLPEVSNNSTASIDDPLDYKSLHSQILRIINDDNYRTTLVNKGCENVRNYDLQRIVDSYIQIYKSILN